MDRYQKFLMFYLVLLGQQVVPTTTTTTTTPSIYSANQSNLAYSSQEYQNHSNSNSLDIQNNTFVVTETIYEIKRKIDDFELIINGTLPKIDNEDINYILENNSTIYISENVDYQIDSIQFKTDNGTEIIKIEGDFTQDFNRHNSSIKYHLDGSNYSDHLYGTDQEDVIHGLNGNDRINSGSGNDFIISGDGLNIIDGGYGNDLIIAGKIQIISMEQKVMTTSQVVLELMFFILILIWVRTLLLILMKRKEIPLTLED